MNGGRAESETASAAVVAEPIDSPRERVRFMTTSHAVDLWLGELARRNHSERTLDTYRRLLRKLSDEHPRADVDELTATQVRRFLDDQARLKRGGRKAAATIAQNVTILNGFLDWLTSEGIIPRNPARRNGQRILSRPRQTAADENDNIVSVSGDEVRRLLEAADNGTGGERIAVYLAAYLGPRRRALATARVQDYDQVERTLTFREKGGKTIAKPVPWKLADILDAAISSGLYESDDDYLIPNRESSTRLDGRPNLKHREGDRDDKIVWHLIRSVADRAGVTTHVHALRAAFAVQYLETHPGQIESLQELMGHRRIETTLVYLRRLNRQKKMETVRDMDWSSGEGEIRTRGTPFDAQPLSRRLLSATQAPHQNEPNSVESFESLHSAATVGLQPSFDALRLLDRARRERAGLAPTDDAGTP